MATRPKLLLLVLVFLFMGSGFTNDLTPAKKQAALRAYIHSYYAEQFTSPQKKNRKSLSQFGYGLSLIPVPLYRIGQFINPHDFGQHSYGKPNLTKENNGVLYTCKGGFIDFSHMRCALDWTVYLAFAMLDNPDSIAMDPEGARFELAVRHMGKLSVEDIAALAQRIAYERLAWHEVASWYYHPPNYTFNEQQSAFTPEDLYSNYLGTVIGRNVVLRIIKQPDAKPFSEIASEEIQKVITSLEPMTTVEKSKQAYDKVDRCKQLKLPAEVRNDDTWYDSGIIFMDQRYVYKRNIVLGPKIEPWLVPQQADLGCSSNTAQVYMVPQKNKGGVPLSRFYTFTIHPDSSLFFADKTGEQLAPTFGSFTIDKLPQITQLVKRQMEKELLPGFDKRDHHNPVDSFDKVIRVLFK